MKKRIITFIFVRIMPLVTLLFILKFADRSESVRSASDVVQSRGAWILRKQQLARSPTSNVSPRIYPKTRQSRSFATITRCNGDRDIMGISDNSLVGLNSLSIMSTMYRYRVSDPWFLSDLIRVKGTACQLILTDSPTKSILLLCHLSL